MQVLDSQDQLIYIIFVLLMIKYISNPSLFHVLLELTLFHKNKMQKYDNPNIFTHENSKKKTQSPPTYLYN